MIQAALSRLIKDKTVLVIAHRMRTVSGADKVIVLSDGTVAEQGKPEDLMNTGRIYPNMVKLQMIGARIVSNAVCAPVSIWKIHTQIFLFKRTPIVKYGFPKYSSFSKI